MQFVDRTLLTDNIDEKAYCQIYSQSDTKSSQSETNSLNTHVSTANSKKSNGDAASTTFSGEDTTQKYYKDLRNTLKSI